MRNTFFRIAYLTFLLSLTKICLGSEIKTSNDSCNSVMDSIDCPLDNKPLKLSALNASTKAGLFDFIEDAWNTITSPLKPVWGHYEETGQRTTGPYTVFQQHQGFQIDRLRSKIQNTNDAYFIFTKMH